MKWQNIFPFVNIGVSNKKNRFGGDFMEKKNKKKKRTWILITAGMVLAGIVAAGSDSEKSSAAAGSRIYSSFQICTVL